MKFEPIPSLKIQEAISEFFRGRKIMYSNFFGAKEEGRYDVCFLDSAMIIRKDEQDFFRTYLVASNYEAALNVLNHMSNKYVFNIPSKRPIDDWKNLFKNANFHSIGIYRRFYTKKIKFRKAAKGDFARYEDFQTVKCILQDNFSIYTDYLPDEKELMIMIEEQRVLVTRGRNGEVLGVLIFTVEGKRCYLNVWIDQSGDGLFLLYKVYNIIAERGIGYVYFWVNSENTNVIKLHELMGAQPDGLIDYTFIKN